jgi:hypothetical protein
MEHDPPVRSQPDELKTCLKKKWGWVVDWWWLPVRQVDGPNILVATRKSSDSNERTT